MCGFRGVCVASPHHVSLVYDFLANGTLGDRLRDTGGNAGGGDEERQPPQPLRSEGLVRIVKDVVDGMLYLHEVSDHTTGVREACSLAYLPATVRPRGEFHLLSSKCAM